MLIDIPGHGRWPHCVGCTKCNPRRGCELPYLTLLIATCVSSIILMLSGCTPSQSSLHQPKPFKADELEACLAVTIDMSSSFADSWEDRAYKLFLELMDQFFTEGTGIESRVVLSQLSGNKNVVLFEGRPEDVRARFRSPEDLTAFLKEHSDPSSSPVYQAVDSVVDYVSSLRGITKNTRVLTVILSDMDDNTADTKSRRKAGYKMVETLKRYRQSGGGLALYFVAPEQIPRWKKILNMAEFDPGHYVLESTLVAHPQLPQFD